MEDRYLFRAKRIDDGELIEGFLIFEKDRAFIAHRVCEVMNSYSKAGEEYGFGNFIEVDPSTICQCTGLKDKNGLLIWENDIISINTYSYEEPEDTVVGVVKYSEANTGFCLDDGDAWIPINEIYGSYTTEYFVEGNIFDNPELMEQEG